MANSDFGASRVAKDGSSNHGKQGSKAQPSKAADMKSASRAEQASPSTARPATSTASKPRTRVRGGVPVARKYTVAGVDPLDQVVYERRSSVDHQSRRLDRLQNGRRRDPQCAGANSPPTSSSPNISEKPASRAKPPLARTAWSAKKARVKSSYRIAHTIREASRSLRRLLRERRPKPTRSKHELSFLLINQYGAFNSPVWFNCGLHGRSTEIERLGR